MTSENKSQVQYKQLGKSGLRVSVPILGAMSIGDPKWGGWPIGEEEALPLLKYAWDHGVTAWDTANVYSNGESERIIGKAIKKYAIPRHKLIILTKCFAPVHESDTSAFMWGSAIANTRDYINQSGLSRAAIFNAVEASLERLGTTYIDLYQIHRFDPNTPPEETMEALHDLIKQGKVRYIGASSMFAWQFQLLNHTAETHGWTKFVSMQNKHSLLYREEEREMNAYCKYAGIGLIPWGPLEGGHLSRPWNSPESKTARNQSRRGAQNISTAEETIIKRVEEVATKNGMTMTQVALAWSVAKNSSPIVGISSIKRLEEAIIGDKTLTEEQMKYLEELYEPGNIQGHR